MNAFESGARKAIPAVLVYVRDDQGRILMLHRNAKANDYHEGKWNGLGGKCEPQESPWEAASRELSEEAGLEIPPEGFRWLGTLQFPNFKPHKAEDWIVFVLTAELSLAGGPAAKAWERGPEGDLVWVDPHRLLELNLWEGDRQFLPKVLANTPFVGTFWYEGQTLRRFEIR